MRAALTVQRIAGTLGGEVAGVDLRDLSDPTVEALRRAWLEHEQVNFGGVWHSDTTYLDIPPMASMLLAREVPPASGDTLFANMYLAYETLSDGMKRTLDGLHAIASSSKADASRTREDRVKDSARADAKKEYVASHPVVRVHPETGRKALYVSVAHTTRFDGWTEEEPLRAAQRDQRLPRLPALDAPHHAGRRQAGRPLNSHA